MGITSSRKLVVAIFTGRDFIHIQCAIQVQESVHFFEGQVWAEGTVEMPHINGAPFYPLIDCSSEVND